MLFRSDQQSGLSFLEGELASGDLWKEERRDRQRVIQEEAQVENQDLVIKVSVPDWKVLAFSTKSGGQLVWEHQVTRQLSPTSYPLTP